MENPSYIEDEPSIFTQQGDSPEGAHNTKYTLERIHAKEIPQFQKSLSIYRGGKKSMANPRVSTERLTPLNLATENIGKVNSKGREPELPVLHLKDLFVNRKCAVKECSSVHSVKRGFRPNLLMTE